MCEKQNISPHKTNILSSEDSYGYIQQKVAFLKKLYLLECYSKHPWLQLKEVWKAVVIFERGMFLYSYI